MGGDDHWKSDHREGHNVEWGHDGHFEHHVHPHDELNIKMMDHEGLMDNEPIGHWNGEAKIFCHENERKRWKSNLCTWVTSPPLWSSTSTSARTEYFYH